MKYTVSTDILKDERILQEIKHEHNDIETTIMRDVFDVKEKQLRDALVKLGWIPPEDKKRIRRVLVLQIGDSRECPKCYHHFTPQDETQQDAIDLYRELFKKK